MAPEDAPATKRDIKKLEDRLAGVEERLLRQMGDMQTELLNIFLPFREETRARNAAMEARQAAIEARFHTVEGRLGQIEKKLLLDPPAA
jgi:hypothetical protein